MNYCPKCNKYVEDDTRYFCSECGSPFIHIVAKQSVIKGEAERNIIFKESQNVREENKDDESLLEPIANQDEEIIVQEIKNSIDDKPVQDYDDIYDENTDSTDTIDARMMRETVAQKVDELKERALKLAKNVDKKVSEIYNDVSGIKQKLIDKVKLYYKFHKKVVTVVTCILILVIAGFAGIVLIFINLGMADLEIEQREFHQEQIRKKNQERIIEEEIARLKAAKDAKERMVKKMY